MNPTQPFRLTTLVAAAVAFAFLAGCAATPSTSRAEKSDSSEYSYINETGSYIPKRVKKGQVSDGSQNIDKVGAAAAGEMVNDQVRRATTTLQRTSGG